MSYEKNSRAIGTNRFTPIGQATVNTLGQFIPNANTPRPNMVNNQDLQNGLAKLPTDINVGLQKMLSEQHIINEYFEKSIFLEGEVDTYRAFFEKEVISKSSGSLSKTFLKHEGMDENPMTAALTGLMTSWEPQLNEVSISGTSIEITTNAYGRIMKKHRYTEELQTVDFYGAMAMEFANNANRTLGKLAGARLYEGSSKLFVKSVAAFDPSNPTAPRLELGAAATDVAAPLNWASILEAKHQLQNYQEQFTIVNQTSGAIEHQKRLRSIGGWKGLDYILVVSRNGYEQLLADPDIKRDYVVNGGILASEFINHTFAINSSYKGVRVQITDNPVYITKEATPKVDFTGVNGQATLLECAFLIGGGNSRIGIELSVEGEQEIINVGYDEDRKTDIFGLLSFTAWKVVMDFSVIRPECVWTIPFARTANIKSGNPVANTTITWKE